MLQDLTVSLKLPHSLQRTGVLLSFSIAKELCTCHEERSPSIPPGLFCTCNKMITAEASRGDHN